MPSPTDPSGNSLLNALMKIVGQAGRIALDLLLPPRCLTCDADVDNPGALCAACFNALSFVSAPYCAACGVPFTHAGQAGADRLCPGCTRRPPAFDRARAAIRYDEPSKRVLLPFKYADRTDLAHPLALHMFRAGRELLAEADLLAPVPLHRWRLITRRYNQAALLAGRLGRMAGRPVVQDLLRRTRATAPLGERSALARAELLEGAIAVRPHRAARVAGRRVLLVDDVMTSGATASACAVALRDAGAIAVDVIVAARVPHPALGA